MFGCMALHAVLPALTSPQAALPSVCIVLASIRAGRCTRHAIQPDRGVQKMLTEEHAILAETGDSWFNCQKLKLPRGAAYECALIAHLWPAQRDASFVAWLARQCLWQGHSCSPACAAV